MARTRVGKPAKKDKPPKDGYPKKVSQIASGRSIRRRRPPEDVPPGQAVQGIEPATPATVTTFKPNGVESRVAAPAPEPPALGPLQIPQGTDAENAMAELGALNDRAIAAGKRWESSKAVAKEDGETYRDLMEQVSKRIRILTHPTDLPLFRENMENDTRKMEQAIADQGGSDEGSEPPADVIGVAPEGSAEPISESAETPADMDTEGIS